MNAIGIIPVRMGSSRFPGKPLAKINGIPMVGHVYFRSKMNKTLEEVYIATCDQEIADYAASIGAAAIMTKNTYERPSDRTAEAMLKIEKMTKKKLDIAVMIQGDEPMVFPEMIDLAMTPMVNDKSIQVVNLAAKLKDEKETEDPNTIKVVVDKNNFALYFSRRPIPFFRSGVGSDAPALKQVCIIPYRRDFLITYNKLEPTPLEKAESIDMLRVLEHGYKVKMVVSPYFTHSVDVVADLRCVETLLKEDTLFLCYKRYESACHLNTSKS